MGQQHRVRTKRKRRQAYLDRKKAGSRTAPREVPRTKAKKQASASSKAE